jgi:hypothetical protein
MDFPSALLNRKAVEFSISIKPENEISPSDDLEDEESIKWIEDQIESGNDWAWCRVKVTARLKEYDIEEYTYLGACSYKNEAAFKKGGYYEGMEDEAFLNLNEKVSRILTIAKKLTLATD